MSSPQLVTILAANEEAIVFDASLRESHDATVEVTEHPVETGADISDHARVKPETLTVTAILSNTPVNDDQASRAASAPRIVDFAATEGAFAAVAGVGAIQGVVGYAEYLYARISGIKTVRQLVTVITGLRSYKNMLITSVSAPRESRTGDAVEFTISFKEVRLVELRRVQVKVAAEPKARAPVDTGKQPSEDVDTKRSVLKAGRVFFFGPGKGSS